MDSESPRHTGKLEDAICAVIQLLTEGQQEWRQIRTSLDDLKTNHELLTKRVLLIEDWSRRPFPKTTVRTYIEVTAKYFNGVCPCCGENQILNDLGGRADNLEVDHFKGPKWNKLHDGWPICQQCHGNLTHGYLNREGWVSQAFSAFQMRVNQYVEAQLDRKQMSLFSNT